MYSFQRYYFPFQPVRLLLLLVFFTFSVDCLSQNTSYFPEFVAFGENPIIKFGDELRASPWNDPTVLKKGDQYILYTSGVEGGLNHPNDTVAIYRWLSSDSYSWTLNPDTPVLKSKAGTYYSGGVETPSVVFYKDQYHMYNTVYVENTPFDFKISHATSTDGISWQIDQDLILAPSNSLDWMSTITAEPGVLVKDDTLYLFFAAGDPTGFLNIGLVRSIDGRSFIDTTLTATLPTEVYPLNDNYTGLSTPSPALLGDTIYLFTDVAQVVFEDNFMQVALHQFKSYGNLNQWIPDERPIHSRSDFEWTNGNLNAEIRSVTPLLDGNNLRIWYAGHRISEIDLTTNDTTNYVFFVGDELHVNKDFWGIGTSEYQIGSLVNNLEDERFSNEIEIQFYNKKGKITIADQSSAYAEIYTIDGRQLLNRYFKGMLAFDLQYQGVIVIRVASQNQFITKKYYSG
ncbi:MAG: hypothetical protein AAF789_09190 [Bacteroidota bacterium]